MTEQTLYIQGDKEYHGTDVVDALAHYGPAQFMLRLSYRLFGDLKLEFSNRWPAFKQLHNLACELSGWQWPPIEEPF